jgi:hypothetical protein
MLAAIAKIRCDLEYRTPTTNKPMSHIAIPREQAIELIAYIDQLVEQQKAADDPSR